MTSSDHDLGTHFSPHRLSLIVYFLFQMHHLKLSLLFSMLKFWTWHDVFLINWLIHTDLWMIEPESLERNWTRVPIKGCCEESCAIAGSNQMISGILLSKQVSVSHYHAWVSLAHDTTWRWADSCSCKLVLSLKTIELFHEIILSRYGVKPAAFCWLN